jgi:CDP-paratose 2-epimerase
MHENVLITGGAGFAGSALAMSIKRRFPDSRVYAFDNLKRRGSEMNLPRLRSSGVEFVHGDVRSLADLLSLPQTPDLIIEASAEPSAQAGYGGSPQYLIDTNLNGCYNCLELARRNHCDFFFLSTSRVYPYRLLNNLSFDETETRFQLTEAQQIHGASAFGVAEDFPLDGARSLYGMSKLAAELMVAEYADAYGFRYFIERFGVLTGPWQMAKSDQGVVALWVAAHVLRKDLAYIGFGGQGKQVRDFLHVDDFCDLVIAQIEDFGAFHGKTLNAGGGNEVSTSLCELTRLCEEVTGNQLHFRAEPESRPADVRVFITDHRRLSAINDWKPLRSAQSTVSDIFEWVRGNEALVRNLIAI